jgi:hypothetical protein
MHFPYLTERRLKMWYSTHGDHVRQVVKAVWESLSHGCLRPAEAITIISEAAHARVPDPVA